MNKSKVSIEYDGFTINKEELVDEAMKAIQELIDSKKETVRELFELSLKTRTLITLASDQMRGIGKTTLVLNKALELDVPVITTSHNYYEFLKTMKAQCNIHYFGSVNDARGYKFPEGFLIDEGTDDEIIKALIRNGSPLLGGFKRL